MRRCGDAWDEARILPVDDGDRRCDCVRRHFDGFEDGSRRGLHLACPRRAHFIDDDCTDVRFNDPQIDVDEMRTTPVPHRYVHGFFAGTGFPALAARQRVASTSRLRSSTRGGSSRGPPTSSRPTRTSAITRSPLRSQAARTLCRRTWAGARPPSLPRPCCSFGFDAETVGYRVNAAAAKFSREVAAEMYGPHRPYGYLFGGSGGAYQTISSAENTTVWDGYVPFVLGNENSIPNRIQRADPRPAHSGAERPVPVRSSTRSTRVEAATRGACDLTEEQAGAYEEATRLGFPPRAWFGPPRWRAPGPSRSSPATSRSWTSATPRTSGPCRATSDTMTRTDRSRRRGSSTTRRSSTS